MSGVFIISFDCEGKWGVADHLDARIEESFTTANLLQNYRDLLALLGEHGLCATFAFVGAYTLSAEAFLDRRVEYEPLLSSSWCREFAAALQRGQLEGWFNPRPRGSSRGREVTRSRATDSHIDHSRRPTPRATRCDGGSMRSAASTSSTISRGLSSIRAIGSAMLTSLAITASSATANRGSPRSVAPALYLRAQCLRRGRAARERRGGDPDSGRLFPQLAERRAAHGSGRRDGAPLDVPPSRRREARPRGAPLESSAQLSYG